MEPAGILLEADFPEAALVSLLRAKPGQGDAKQSVGHILSDLLSQGDEEGDILILHHDAAAQRLFFGWIMVHFAEDRLEQIWPVIGAIAAKMPPGGTGNGVLTTTLPHAFGTLLLEDGRVIRGDGAGDAADRVTALSDKLWGFARKDRFPDAAASMRRRDYQCKPFRRAWKRYLDWRDEVERPARIAAATSENPYRLFGQALTWDGRVYADHSYTNQMIELPGADPASLRWVAGFYADDRHVWLCRPAANSPPLRAMGRYGQMINNPDAIFEYVILEGTIGKDFEWLDDRWDTLYWTDKRRIYALGKDGLTPLPDVQAGEFETFGQSFGRTPKSVICGENLLPLDPARLRSEGVLIWDDQRLFRAATEVALSPDGLTVLGEVREYPSQPLPALRVENREGRFLIHPDGHVTPDAPDEGAA